MEMKFRKLSVDGCPVIGAGANGHVYRLDEETIVKVMDKKEVPEELILKEKNNARSAFILGVPTAISYDVVHVGHAPGIVYEKINAKTIQELVREDPKKIEPLMRQAARLLREIHAIEVPDGRLPLLEELFYERISQVSDYFTQEETELLKCVTASLSGRHTYVHGDYHFGNLMLKDKELILIDMFNSSAGHPMYDFMSSCQLGAQLAKDDPDLARKTFEWEPEWVLSSWDVLLEEYFQGSGYAPDEWSECITFYTWLRRLTYLKRLSWLTEEQRRERIDRARREFFPSAAENLKKYAPMIAKLK